MGSIGSREFRVACMALACAAVPAAAAAASADYYLKLEGVPGESKDDRHKGEIEIQSFSWGAAQGAAGDQVDPLTDGLLLVRNSAAPGSGPTGGAGGGGGSGGMVAGKVSVRDLSVMRGPRQTTSVDGAKVAAGDVNGDGRPDAAAAGKYGAVSGLHRNENLAGARSVGLAKPLDTGSITIPMKLAGCAVGKHYASAVLTTPGGRYELQDLVVASCGGGPGASLPMEQVTLNYTKVHVRAWDPKKKEE